MTPAQRKAQKARKAEEKARLEEEARKAEEAKAAEQNDGSEEADVVTEDPAVTGDDVDDKTETPEENNNKNVDEGDGIKGDVEDDSNSIEDDEEISDEDTEEVEEKDAEATLKDAINKYLTLFTPPHKSYEDKMIDKYRFIHSIRDAFSGDKESVVKAFGVLVTSFEEGDLDQTKANSFSSDWKWNRKQHDEAMSIITLAGVVANTPKDNRAGIMTSRNAKAGLTMASVPEVAIEAITGLYEV